MYHEEIGNLEGTIKNQETFARGNAINEIQRLVDQYGGRKKEWRKVKGEGLVITDIGLARTAELHWYERNGMRVEIRVKRWIN